MSKPTLVTLAPGRWTPVPDTHFEVRWDGNGEITVYWHGDAFDLPPCPPGCLLARITRDGHPATPPWPILASAGPNDATGGVSPRCPASGPPRGTAPTRWRT